VRFRYRVELDTHVEKVDGCSGIETGLLVVGCERDRPRVLFRVKSRVDINFQALCEVVLELNVRLEDVLCRPRLGKRHTVLGISVLGLQVTLDDTLRVAVAHDAEADGRRRACLHLKEGAMEGEVLRQEVVRRLADILRGRSVPLRRGRQRRQRRRTFQAGGVGNALIFLSEKSRQEDGRKSTHV